MTVSTSSHARECLKHAPEGEGTATAELVKLVYEELRHRAQDYLRRERPGHTLQPTALVHEAFLRLAAKSDVDWRGRTHFYGAATHEMKRILVDHARTRGAVKRGARWSRVTLDEGTLLTGESAIDTLDLKDALGELAQLDPRAARVIELRFFDGLTVEETGHALGVSHRTVEEDWRTARAWLLRRLPRAPEHHADES